MLRRCDRFHHLEEHSAERLPEITSDAGVHLHLQPQPSAQGSEELSFKLLLKCSFSSFAFQCCG